MITKLENRFVESIPKELEDGILYISPRFRVVMHACCCGCKNKVVTPLSPVRWRMTFDGKTVSLHPSIGNWNFECKSHYWIVNSEVKWVRKWTNEEIEEGKKWEKGKRAEYYTKNNSILEKKQQVPKQKESLASKIITWTKKIFS